MCVCVCVRAPHMLPGDALSLVFSLLLSEDQLDEELLQLLVAVVDAELFKTVKTTEEQTLEQRSRQ